MASLRTKVLALASPALEIDRASKLRCVKEAKEAVGEEGCAELAQLTIEAGEFAFNSISIADDDWRIERK